MGRLLYCTVLRVRQYSTSGSTRPGKELAFSTCVSWNYFAIQAKSVSSNGDRPMAGVQYHLHHLGKASHECMFDLDCTSMSLEHMPSLSYLTHSFTSADCYVFQLCVSHANGKIAASNSKHTIKLYNKDTLQYLGVLSLPTF